MDNAIFQLIMDLYHKKQQDCKPILVINLCVNRRIAFEINAYKLTSQHSSEYKIQAFYLSLVNVFSLVHLGILLRITIALKVSHL